MNESSFASAAQAVASRMAAQLLSDPGFEHLSLEELVEQACIMEDTKRLFQEQGVDLEDDNIQLEVLCEFQKAMADEMVKMNT